MTDKIVSAEVTGLPFFSDSGVLHMPGEFTNVNLSKYDAKSVDDEQIIGLKKPPRGGEEVAIVPIAAVAPHAPNATSPQAIPPGTIPAPSGRLIAPSEDGDAGAVREFRSASADVQDGATDSTAKKAPAKKA